MHRKFISPYRLRNKMLLFPSQRFPQFLWVILLSWSTLSYHLRVRTVPHSTHENEAKATILSIRPMMPGVDSSFPCPVYAVYMLSGDRDTGVVTKPMLSSPRKPSRAYLVPVVGNIFYDEVLSPLYLLLPFPLCSPSLDPHYHNQTHRKIHTHNPVTFLFKNTSLWFLLEWIVGAKVEVGRLVRRLLQ